MNKIITVTLNPSLDETLITSHLNLGYLNHVVDSKHLDASGRGVNISRALTRLGTATHALVVLGNDTFSYAYKGLLNEEAFPSTIIRYPGPTRSDTIIVDRSEHTETHIMDEASVGPRDKISELLDALISIISPEDTVVCSGILPHETPIDVYAQITRAAHQAGAQVVIMAGEEALKQALYARPEMVVVTRLEAETLFNFPVRTLPDMKYSASKIQERGTQRVLVVQDDLTGALLAEGDQMWQLELVEADHSGTNSGVIDALLAGYLAGRLNHLEPEAALHQGGAAMAFAAARIGNVFGKPDEIHPLRERISVQPLDVTDPVSSPAAAGASASASASVSAAS